MQFIFLLHLSNLQLDGGVSVDVLFCVEIINNV